MVHIKAIEKDDVTLLWRLIEPHSGPDFRPCCPAPGIKSPFSYPYFVLALAGIRRLVVHIMAIEKDDLIPL